MLHKYISLIETPVIEQLDFSVKQIPTGYPTFMQARWGGTTCYVFDTYFLDTPPSSSFLVVDRFTNQGDTVVCVGAECNAGVEVSLLRGRKIGAYLSDDSKRDAVQKRMDLVFAEAFEAGCFTVIMRLVYTWLLSVGIICRQFTFCCCGSIQ